MSGASGLLATDFVSGVAVGLVGGLTSGLLGVSPGGGLVVFSVLLLGAEQHVAHGVSLAAQVPPTSLAGIRQYWEKGHRAPLVWLLLIGGGGRKSRGRGVARLSAMDLRRLSGAAERAPRLAPARSDGRERRCRSAAAGSVDRACRRRRSRRILVRLSRHRRRPGDHGGPQRRTWRPTAAGADDEPRPVDSPGDVSRRLGLLARGRARALAGPRRGHSRPCRRNRPRRAPGQQGQRSDPAPPPHRFCLGHGLYMAGKALT